MNDKENKILHGSSGGDCGISADSECKNVHRGDALKAEAVEKMNSGASIIETLRFVKNDGRCTAIQKWKILIELKILKG